MPSIKDLKRRIGSVRNTQQTTRAMKMVSAAKLRRAQDSIVSHRPYAKTLGKLIRLAASLSDESFESPLIKKADLAEEEGRKKKILLVLVTSDRGLCGGFNSNVLRTAQRWIQQNKANYSEIELGFLGKKGYDIFKTKKVSIGPYFSEQGGKVSFAKAKKLSELLIVHYTDGKADEIKVIYNEFKNAVSQAVQIENFLPLESIGSKEEGTGAEKSLVYMVKPNSAELLERLISRNFAIQAFRIMLESQAGEHGARMSAMESATKNAGEMIKKLTLQYNKQRQAGITKELLEIISGSESQKNSS